MRWGLCILAIAAHHVSACSCLVRFSLCQEVAASSTVFIGKVESVYPSYLDSANRRKAVEFRDEVSRLHSEPSPGAIQQLKAVYSNMLGVGPGGSMADFERASSIEQLDTVFDRILAQGKRVQLRVRRKFNEAADDDQPNHSAGSAAPIERLVVWTGVDDCGVDFQSGETYLIYAGSDEQTGKLETSVCSRTRRLTGATEDLGYLFFIGQGEGKNVQIEGKLVPPLPDRSADQPASGAPLPSGLVVALIGEGQTRYTRSGPDGGFVFDGLGPGTYKISVYPAAFPRVTASLGEPVQISVREKTCAKASIPLRPGWSAY
jgi:hypothetical protein